MVLGGSGQLGRALLATAPVDWNVASRASAELDIRDERAVTAALTEAGPQLVVNAAAYTAVDAAEDDAAAAFAVNARGAANVAMGARACGARLFHVSTDFVFGGDASAPYCPDAVTAPVNVYGASKLQGEQEVLTRHPGALVLRTAWLYSAHGKNFCRTMLNLMSSGKPVRVVADQVGTPTWAGSLARAIWAFARIPEARGILHWTDAGVASWYDFSVAIGEEAVHMGILAHRAAVIPISSEEYPTRARRPRFSVLDKSAAWKMLGYASDHWRASLRSMLAEYREARGV